MVTITSQSIGSLEPALEHAGELRDHTPVDCSVVLAEDPNAETYVIVPGFGARADSYYGLQKAAALLGMNSVCVDPIYHLSKHQNRLQAAAAEVAVEHARELDLNVRFAYGHSWGGSKLASLLHYGIPGVEVAVFHNTAGIESVFRNVTARPLQSLRRIGGEIIAAIKKPEVVPKVQVSRNSYRDMAAFVQQSFVASQHRRLIEQLETARERGIILVGLWPESDMFYTLQEHDIFHKNETLPKSNHTEPQHSPERVAQKMLEYTRLAKVSVMPAKKTDRPMGLAA